MTFCPICCAKLTMPFEVPRGFCSVHSNVPNLVRLILENQIHWVIRVRYLANLHRICRIRNGQWKINNTAKLLYFSPSYCGKLLKLADFHFAVKELSMLDSWENAYKLILSCGNSKSKVREILKCSLKATEVNQPE